MAVNVDGTFLHWSQRPLPPRISPSHKTLVFSLSLNSSDSAILNHIAHQSYFLETSMIHRFQQSGKAGGRRCRVRSSSSASHDGFQFINDSKDGDNEYVKRINEISPKFKNKAVSRMDQDEESSSKSSSKSDPFFSVSHPVCSSSLSVTSEMRTMRTSPETAGDGFALDKVELRVNSFDLPLSLRILKRKKKRWESADMTNSACSSVKKAFSSLVFILQELQSHTIRMREALFFSTSLQIQGILARVQNELHASFVWLFQRIFSTTPTLMVCLMLLLANFTLFSITDYPADAMPPTQSVSTAMEESGNPSPQLDSFPVKSFSTGKSISVGGGGDSGGGGNAHTVAGAADDEQWGRSLSYFHEDGNISSEMVSTTSTKEEDDEAAWKGIVEEAELIRANVRHEVLMDPDTLRQFVSPLTVELEPDDLTAYAATELSYRRALAEDLNDPLILSNFAQFLYVVLRDHDRAEEYFKRAALVEPADAEALSRYANFLWVARKDLGAAEEIFLEAIAADPGNSHHSANYAHFLWSTGGEDTCYPLDACDT